MSGCPSSHASLSSTPSSSTSSSSLARGLPNGSRRSFVNQLGGSRSGEAVCRAIVALGQSLQVQVLAEGVETAEQVHALRRLGCQTMQGFLFSRPVPADQIPEAIARAGELAACLLRDDAAQGAAGASGASGARTGQTLS